MDPAPAKYAVRADIEGLRALAVLAVVVGHVAPSLLRGGFCGVDVFFVISGYLIGKHLLEDIEAGEFSFLRFYARRARRILPALVTVLVAVWGIGWMILSGPELAALGRHIAAAAVFSSMIAPAVPACCP
jgi:peptidoglycan/LPS O-acetylase OafA/YrhL